jgi:hypothetical protein
VAVNTYDIGDVVRLSANFNDTTQDVDPAGVTFKIKTPVGTVVTLVYGVDGAVVKDSTGDYHVDYEPPVEGTYYYRAVGTTTNKGAAESRFVVRESRFN